MDEPRSAEEMPDEVLLIRYEAALRLVCELIADGSYFAAGIVAKAALDESL